MVDENFIVRFQFDVRDAKKSAVDIANGLATVSRNLRELGQDTKYIDQSTRSLSKMAEAAQSVNKVSQYRNANGTFASYAEGVKRAESALASNRAELDRFERSAIAAAFAGEKYAGFVDGVPPAAKKAENSVRGLAGSLGDLRSAGYELLVTGGIFTRFGQLVVSGLGGVVGTAIDYERAFANVIRTTGDGTIAISQLRNELVELSTIIPVTFQDLTEIASLGGQLGIAGSGIDDFTSVVARLTATTNLTADAAGTALGRFQALLGVPSDEFENLASAILKVGVNSVATETQIVAISTQISSMADFAGFTAAQVVGLAGALASVGAQPELSRGTITRTFALMSKAIAAGGEDLLEFARISGVSGAEFASSFGTAKFAPIFQSFLSNLGSMQEQGENTVITLNRLGITSVRDVPLLLRLAGATDTVSRAFDDANTGYAQASTLQEQYGIIASTTASRIQLLVNNVTNLLDTIGSSATGPISEFVDGLSEIVKQITAFLSTPFGQNVALLVLSLTALVGVVVTIAGAAAFAAGTFLLLANAGDKLGISMFTVAEGSTLAATAVARLSAAGKVAAIAFGQLGLALAAFSLLQTYRADIDDFESRMKGLGTTVQDTIKRLSNPTDPSAFLGLKGLGSLADGTKETNAANRSLGGFAPFASQDFADIAKVDEALKAMIDRGQIVEAQKQFAALREESKRFGVTQEQFNAAFPDTVNGLKNISIGAQQAAQDTYDMANAELELQTANEKLASSLGLLPEELKKLQDNLTSGSEGFFNYGEIVKAVYEDGEGSALEFSDALAAQITAQQTWADSLAQLSARGATAFVSELAALGPEGAELAASAVNLTSEELFKLEDQARLAAFLASDAFAQEFTNNTPALIEAYRTGGIAGVQAMIAAQREQQAGLSATVSEGVAAAMDAGNATAQENPILTEIKNQAAQEKLDQFLRDNGYKTIDVQVNLRPGTAIGIDTPMGRQYAIPRYVADGGYIRGPGTATSDSISARLSNGEYVIKAASVRKYGTGMFDQLNKGVAKFARGGQVGPQHVISHSSPTDRQIARSGSSGGRIIQLVVDSKVLAEVVDNGNFGNQFDGSN